MALAGSFFTKEQSLSTWASISCVPFIRVSESCKRNAHAHQHQTAASAYISAFYLLFGGEDGLLSCIQGPLFASELGHLENRENRRSKSPYGIRLVVQPLIREDQRPVSASLRTNAEALLRVQATQPMAGVCLTRTISAIPQPSADSLSILCTTMQALQTQCACLGASTSGWFAPRGSPARPQIRGAQPASRRQRRAWLVQATAGVTTCML